MSLTGNVSGSLQNLVNCDGVSANQSLSVTGSAAPKFSIVAPAALAGTITSGTVTLSAPATFAGTEKVALYWIIAGVAYYRYDCTIASGTGVTTFAITSGTGTALPSGGQAILLATNQDVTDDVSITGENINQLLVTSTQPGLVEWNTVTPTQERLSYILASGAFDTWPTQNGQIAPPSGWSGSTTVVSLRFWNFSINTAQMTVKCILA